MYHLKHNPTTMTYYETKIKLEADLPPCNRLSQPHLCHSSQDHSGCESESCAGVNMVYSQTDRVFILEHYFA
jgi:hypothetical protein